jgi:hypothetical protein
MRGRRSAQPPLTDAVVQNEQRLGAAIDAFLVQDEVMRRRRRQILRRQREVRHHCSEQAWAAYLRLEEAVNARLDLALMIVAKWAYTEGRRR